MSRTLLQFLCPVQVSATMVTNIRLDVQRQLFARSQRVKGIDFHPSEPWILTTLYNGTTREELKRSGMEVLT